MRRTLFLTALWLLGLFAILRGVGRFDNLDSDHANVQRIADLAGLSDLDLLLVGNSYAHTGIDPRMLAEAGIESYSLGINAAGVAFYRLLVEDYSAHTEEPPEMVMFLVSPMTFSRHADAFASVPIHRYLSEPLSDEAVAIAHGADYADLIRRSFRKGLDNAWRAARGELEPTRDGALFRRRGFVPSERTYDARLFSGMSDAYAVLAGDSFPEEDVAALLALARDLHRAGTAVAFLELPTFKASSWFSSRYLASYETGLAELTRNGFTVHRIDWETSPRDFRNADHLNSAGARRASALLIERLTAARRTVPRAALEGSP